MTNAANVQRIYDTYKSVDVTCLQSAGTPVQPSNYTSLGRRKCTPVDPIRKIEDIKLIGDYLLTKGRPMLRPRNYALFILGISVGIRAGDLLRLKVRDVAYKNLNGRWSIVSEISCYESKTHKMNHPIINQEAQKVLDAYLNDNEYHTFRPEEYLFYNTQKNSDEPLKSPALHAIFADVQKNLNLPYHLGTHSLRKTFAYWTVRMHLNNPNVIYSLQEMLNHDSVKTTLHYSGQTKDDLTVMYNDIGGLVNGTATNEPVSTEQDRKLDRILALLGDE